MELYLRWVAKHETEQGEQSPLGIILCAGKNTNQIGLLELKSAAIHAAKYLTLITSSRSPSGKVSGAMEMASIEDRVL